MERPDVSSPRGSFVLQSGKRPIVLLSAGIGVTPVLAMLHALASARSTRQVLWLHVARDGQHHPFAAEVRRLMLELPRSWSYVCYSRPDLGDKKGENFNVAGRLSQSILNEVGVPRDADVYVCGPTLFMADNAGHLCVYTLRYDVSRSSALRCGSLLRGRWRAVFRNSRASLCHAKGRNARGSHWRNHPTERNREERLP
jgi:ferredoxin-NADP reductase